MVENAAQQQTVNKISQGRQGDPKETNILQNPVIEHLAERDDAAIRVKAVKAQHEVKKSNAKRESAQREDKKSQVEGYGMNVVEVHPQAADRRKEQLIAAALKGTGAGPQTKTSNQKVTKTAAGTGAGRVPPPKKRVSEKRSDASADNSQQIKSGRTINNP